VLIGCPLSDSMFTMHVFARAGQRSRISDFNKERSSSVISGVTPWAFLNVILPSPVKVKVGVGLIVGEVVGRLVVGLVVGWGIVGAFVGLEVGLPVGGGVVGAFVGG